MYDLVDYLENGNYKKLFSDPLELNVLEDICCLIRNAWRDKADTLKIFPQGWEWSENNTVIFATNFRPTNMMSLWPIDKLVIYRFINDDVISYYIRLAWETENEIVLEFRERIIDLNASLYTLLDLRDYLDSGRSFLRYFRTDMDSYAIESIYQLLIRTIQDKGNTIRLSNLGWQILMDNEILFSSYKYPILSPVVPVLIFLEENPLFFSQKRGIQKILQLEPVLQRHLTIIKETEDEIVIKITASATE